LAGSVALVATLAFSVAFVTPYRTTWAWISFIGMVALEDVVAGRRREGWGWSLPRLTLLAAIIVFRKHPDVTLLVALSAALLAGLALRNRWFTLLGKAASWIIAASVGSAVLGLVGFADTAHFVAATAMLLVVYATLDGILQHLLESPGSASLDWSTARRALGALGLGLAGALLALGWRTPSVGPLALRLAEVCVLALVGMLIGFALGGTARGPSGGMQSLRRLPPLVVVAGALLVVSTRVPNPLSAMLAAAALAALAIWALGRRAYYAVCLIVGGLSNEIARAANGGRMPVETAGLPPGAQADYANLTRDSSTYVLAGPQTHLAWLGDRFAVPIFPGIASLGDILVAVGIVWLAAALTVERPSLAPSEEVPSQAA
jgi:hypothetical protein